MSERSKRIVQMGRKIAQTYDLSQSEDDPYSSDSLSDPNYSPTSDDNSSFGADCKISYLKNKLAVDTKINRNKLQYSNIEINKESSNTIKMGDQVSDTEVNEDMVEIIVDEESVDEMSQTQPQTSVHAKNINTPQCSNSEINRECNKNKKTENQNIDEESESMSEMNENEDSDDDQTQAYNVTWKDPVGNHLQFVYDVEHGITPEYAAALIGNSPYDFFSVFVDDEIFNMIVDETNLYAEQLITNSDDIAPSSRLHSWEPTSNKEIKLFLGILGYMGMVRKPTVQHYWCKRKLFTENIVPSIMSRNRFELLLKVWHFSDNQKCPVGDRGYKVESLIQLLVRKFQEVYTPGHVFCIDETIVPFRGRLIMKQYMPQKTHKYGIKLFKLCADNGYTWNIKLYCGKEQDAGASVPTKVVMTLSEKLLNVGRLAVTDNYYTSLELANKLLDKKTHLLGTLRSNRRGNPKEVTSKKLKVGETFAKENPRGICVIKWRDRRDVLMLSTKHTDKTVTVNRRKGPIEKPIAVVDYNSGKSSIDLSDQMASYNTALRKTIKWYRKIAIELLLGTAMVNAHFLYKKINDSTVSITDFREKVVEELLFQHTNENSQDQEKPLSSASKRRRMINSHQFKKKDGPSHKTRKYCKGCYSKKIDGLIEKNKVKKVSTYCEECDGQPHYCLECFSSTHNKPM